MKLSERQKVTEAANRVSSEGPWMRWKKWLDFKREAKKRITAHRTGPVSQTVPLQHQDSHLAQAQPLRTDLLYRLLLSTLTSAPSNIELNNIYIKIIQRERETSVFKAA